MRSLITGVGGFAGQHLAARLLQGGEDVCGIARRPVRWHVTGVAGDRRFSVLSADLTSRDAVRRSVQEAVPARIYHLAAMSSVEESFRDPLDTLNNNIATTVNLLEAVRADRPSARVLVVSSAEIYGRAGDGRPIVESNELRPESPYAVSKAAVDLLGYQYAAAFGLEVIRVRPFNHLGPGQTDRFVAAAFARQIAEIEAGLRAPVVLVGNLDARRDFTDVRDIVRAYEIACLTGEAGAAYNIGRGTAVPIRSLLDQLIALSRVPVELRVDPDRLRPSDAPLLVCDPRRFRELSGWEPEIPLSVSLSDMLNDWRERVAAERSPRAGASPGEHP